MSAFRFAVIVALAVTFQSHIAGARIFAADASDLPVFSEVNLQELGIKPIAEAKDPKTGFVVGGKNATQLLKNLTEINGRSIADLERDMRPDAESDVGSTKGFLGQDESLLDILAADNAFVVDERRLSHQKIARELFILAAIGSKQAGREFLYRGVRFKVSVALSRGFQLSPFRDGTKTNADATVENLDNNQRIEYSLLVPHMIERYGFFEGRGTPYRLEPAKVLKVLTFLSPANASR